MSRPNRHQDHWWHSIFSISCIWDLMTFVRFNDSLGGPSMQWIVLWSSQHLVFIQCLFPASWVCGGSGWRRSTKTSLVAGCSLSKKQEYDGDIAMDGLFVWHLVPVSRACRSHDGEGRHDTDGGVSSTASSLIALDYQAKHKKPCRIPDRPISNLQIFQS